MLTGARARAGVRGDSRLMVSARRQFLEAGYYRPLIDSLADVILAETARQADFPVTVLDLGCGEGTVLCGVVHRFKDLLPHRRAVVWAGVDLSKDAIRLAARRCGSEVSFAVANAHHLPVADRSISICLSVFAPVPAAELDRVLRPMGRLIVVRPGQDHLAALQDLVYETVQPHDEEQVRAELPGMREIWSERVRFDLTVKQPFIGQLLAMTPYYWSASPEVQDAVSAMPELKTPVDFLIECFERGDE